MPVYEYACTSCGERTEAKQSFTDPPLEECPNCAGRLRKLYSPVGIVFKGTGFYSTDAKKDAKKDKAPSTKPKDTKEGKEGKEGTKAEPAVSSAAEGATKRSTKEEKSA
jgi:putative FmdB family regulatory protein